MVLVTGPHWTQHSESSILGFESYCATFYLQYLRKTFLITFAGIRWGAYNSNTEKGKSFYLSELLCRQKTIILISGVGY